MVTKCPTPSPVASSTLADYSREHMLAVLCEPRASYTIPMAPENAVKAQSAPHFGIRTLTAGAATGPLLGGNSYQKLGLVNAYKTDDLGRFVVTKNDDDRFKFKVPTLRNIAITGPYLHDGSKQTLEEIVREVCALPTGKRILVLAPLVTHARVPLGLALTLAIRLVRPFAGAGLDLELGRGFAFETGFDAASLSGSGRYALTSALNVDDGSSATGADGPGIVDALQHGDAHGPRRLAERAVGKEGRKERMALELDPRSAGIVPSTKGSL